MQLKKWLIHSKSFKMPPNNKTIPSLLLIILAGVFACKSNGGNAGGNSSPPLEVELYKRYCTSCHGMDGKLQFGGSPDLSLSSISRPEVVERIKKGKDMMNGFERLLSKEDIEALADYVITLRK